MNRLNREQMIEAAEFYYTSHDTDRREVARWHLRRAVPRVDILSLFGRDYGKKRIDEIIDEALRLEAERASEPEPEYISHDDLVNNVEYLKENVRDFGVNVPDVMIPLMLEYPHARLHEMVWETHRDAPAEEIVAELYRREAAGRAGDGDAAGHGVDGRG